MPPPFIFSLLVLFRFSIHGCFPFLFTFEDVSAVFVFFSFPCFCVTSSCACSLFCPFLIFSFSLCLLWYHHPPLGWCLLFLLFLGGGAAPPSPCWERCCHLLAAGIALPSLRLRCGALLPLPTGGGCAFSPVGAVLSPSPPFGWWCYIPP